MTVYDESGFHFTFKKVHKVIRHDNQANGDGNDFWPGVDFRVIENEREVWIEVES